MSDFQHSTACAGLSRMIECDDIRQVKNIFHSYFTEDDPFMLGFCIERASGFASYASLHLFCSYVIKHNQVDEVIMYLISSRDSDALRDFLSAVPQERLLQVSFTMNTLMSQSISWGCLLALYEYKCISWNENNILYDKLACHILYKETHPCTELRQVVQSCYQLANTTLKIRRTYANDLVERVARTLI